VTHVTLAWRACGVLRRYNLLRPQQMEKNEPVPILFNPRERTAEADEARLERRRGPDRRTRVARALMYGSFNPRRLGPRRDGEHRLGAVDWYHPWWLAIATVILLSCAADAVLTVVLLNRGAYELNPLLAPLVRTSGVLFVVVKVGLTGTGVVLLTLLSRLKAFGRLPVALLLYAVLAAYGTLIAYELRLLGWL
jgi:hypothetical protein